MSGEIPSELGNLSDLQWLDLATNRLSGEIPSELGSLSNLEALQLHKNELSGEIPPELGSLSYLQYLWLSSNQLTGEIPAELGNLDNLEDLYLFGNQLTGEIPAELGNLDNLEDLYLSGNLLTGCIPEGLRAVPENDLNQLGLLFCDCATGRAVADATDNPGLVSDCEALLAARDTLAGDATLNWSADTPIAGWDGITLGGTPERVTQLRLIRRGLTGALPSELGSLTNLRMLVLWGNLLTGAIPSELSSLANLQAMESLGERIELA